MSTVHLSAAKTKYFVSFAKYQYSIRNTLINIPPHGQYHEAQSHRTISCRYFQLQAGVEFDSNDLHDPITDLTIRKVQVKKPSKNKSRKGLPLLSSLYHILQSRLDNAIYSYQVYGTPAILSHESNVDPASVDQVLLRQSLLSCRQFAIHQSRRMSGSVCMTTLYGLADQERSIQLRFIYQGSFICTAQHNLSMR